MDGTTVAARESARPSENRLSTSRPMWSWSEEVAAACRRRSSIRYENYRAAETIAANEPAAHGVPARA
jgi:hypothetical protein